MICIVNIGMNHETAPVELRECVARDPDSAGRALVYMRKLECIKESLFLSTCNRVEVLYTTENPQDARQSIISLMAVDGDEGGFP